MTVCLKQPPSTVYDDYTGKLCSVPKHKKTMMCPTEKIHVLDKIHSGINYSATGYKFNVNE